MDFSIFAIFAAMALICVVFVMMPRTLFLATLEIVGAGFSVLAIIAPRCLLETFLPDKAANFNETDEVFLACFVMWLLQLSMLSFLTRRTTNDESVLRSLMSMWMMAQLVLAVDAFHNIIQDGTTTKTIGKSPDNTTVSTFDMNTLAKTKVSLASYLYDIMVLVAIVVVLIRWPSFKVKVTMSSANRVNKYLLLDQLFILMFSTMDLMYPEYFLQISGQKLPTTDITMTLIRLRACLLLMTAIQNQAIQTYYSGKDKIPYFQANLALAVILFSFLFSRAFSATSSITPQLCCGSMVVTSPCIINQVLGYIAARRDAEEKKKDC